jgi:ribosome biogenesis GTPase / thiamine phosphate phosphatase
MTRLLEGRVVSHLGKGIAVEVGDRILLCQTLRKLDTVVVGDWVQLIESGPDQGRIEAINPRRSVLQRPSRGDTVRPVIANLDMIYVVFAVEPACDFLLVDQYLAICENNTINAALVLNKTDLKQPEHIEQELRIYQEMGYPLFRVSTRSEQGLQELKNALKDRSNLFAGQSGVGKSSLTNAILPTIQTKTNTVSETTRHGRHTTTAATLYALPMGGELIDSPGVAIFGLAGLSEFQLAFGFREFQPFIGQCRFNDCRHINDKDCAVRRAVDNGEVTRQRYERFLKLREKMPPSQRSF